MIEIPVVRTTRRCEDCDAEMPVAWPFIGSCVICYRWVIRTVSLWLPSPPTSGALPKMVTHDPIIMTSVAFYRSDRPQPGGRYGNCLH
jgi:hypothetical protein